MADEYMGDSGGGESAPEPSGEKNESKTALLPLDFFQGKELNPGDTCKVKVEQVMDDQASVSYMGDEESGESYPDNETAEAPAAPADDMMS